MLRVGVLLLGVGQLSGVPARWSRLRQLLLLALVTSAVAACSDVARAEQVDGPFQLAFEMPRTSWTPLEPITGSATLSLTSGALDIGGSGSGVIGFEFAEIGGQHHVVPGSRLSCESRRIISGSPIAAQIAKSGGYYTGGPDAAWLASFFADPVVRLPAGDWLITAVASFNESPYCDGPGHTVRASVRIHVAP